MKFLLNPDASGDDIFRCIKYTQYKQSLANYLRTGSFGATAVIEVYEL